MIKRAFDFLAALTGLILLLPVFLVVAALIKLDSTGPVFFRQKRVGRGFRPFSIYKFRTMVRDAARLGGQVTFGGTRDPRITRVGRALRETKIDELPQLVNVLKGDMSLVGPRPEVAEYVELFREDYREILAVRPGMTDLASLEYRDEARLLADAADPVDEYVRHILPEKIRLAKEYLRRASFLHDCELIARTVLRLFVRDDAARRLAQSRAAR